MERRQEITPRNLRFDLAAVEMRWWHTGAPDRTMIFDALSLMFPHGEKFFIDAVRLYADGVTDEALKRDIKGFSAQEAIHLREHNAYNRRLTTLGYPAEKLDDGMRRLFKFVRNNLSKPYQLAIACALEHFTAILAQEILVNPAHLDGADPAFVRMWQWHAIEEVEHRSVAFNVYGDRVGTGLRAYLVRVHAMTIVTFNFNRYILRHVRAMMRVDGLSRSPAAWLRLLRFLFVKPGVFRRVWPRWAAYFLPGFHPQAHGAVPDVAGIEAAVLSPSPA